MIDSKNIESISYNYITDSMEVNLFDAILFERVGASLANLNNYDPSDNELPSRYEELFFNKEKDEVL